MKEHYVYSEPNHCCEVTPESANVNQSDPHIPEELRKMNVTLEEYDKVLKIVLKIASENVDAPWVVKQNLYRMRERCHNSIGLCKITINDIRRKTNSSIDVSQLEIFVKALEEHLVPIKTPYNNSILIYSLLLVREEATFALLSKTSNSMMDFLANSSPS